MFGCQSFEIFWKKTNFQTCKIFGKNFWNLSSEKSLDIYQNCTSILKILKKTRKVCVFESKNPVFGSKSLEKVFENYEKMTLNSNFGNRQKLVPTQKPTRKFG